MLFLRNHSRFTSHGSLDGLFEQPAGHHQVPGEAVAVVMTSRDW
jgi:hypothetical protein